LTGSIIANEIFFDTETPLLNTFTYIIARDSSGLTSAKFPDSSTISDFGILVQDSSEYFKYDDLNPLKFTLDTVQANLPQLVGCGCTPAFLQDGKQKELIAIVRQGRAKIDYVIWEEDRASTIFKQQIANKIGELPNGDFIYSLKVNAKTDIFSSRNTFKAFDVNQNKSNDCFKIILYEK